MIPFTKGLYVAHIPDSFGLWFFVDRNGTDIPWHNADYENFANVAIIDDESLIELNVQSIKAYFYIKPEMADHVEQNLIGMGLGDIASDFVQGLKYS
jgi:hypothetical protein